MARYLQIMLYQRDIVMYKSKLILLFALILVSGCVTTGQKFTTTQKPNNDNALVYVYRPSSPPILLTPTILINKINVAELTNKGYFEIYLDPGKYTIDSDWSVLSGVPDGTVTFHADAGQTYFVLFQHQWISLLCQF